MIEGNPWTRVVWGSERHVWRINIFMTKNSHFNFIESLQVITFGEYLTEGRTVCTTIPAGIIGTEYSVWCSTEAVAHGVELIYPPDGQNRKINVAELQVLGYE